MRYYLMVKDLAKVDLLKLEAMVELQAIDKNSVFVLDGTKVSIVSLHQSEALLNCKRLNTATAFMNCHYDALKAKRLATKL